MLVTEKDLKKATGEKTIPGLKKWCTRQGIKFFTTKNGITTTESALNLALNGSSLDEIEPNWDAMS